MQLYRIENDFSTTYTHSVCQDWTQTKFTTYYGSYHQCDFYLSPWSLNPNSVIVSRIISSARLLLISSSKFGNHKWDRIIGAPFTRLLVQFLLRLQIVSSAGLWSPCSISVIVRFRIPDRKLVNLTKLRRFSPPKVRFRISDRKLVHLTTLRRFSECSLLEQYFPVISPSSKDCLLGTKQILLGT